MGARSGHDVRHRTFRVLEVLDHLEAHGEVGVRGGRGRVEHAAHAEAQVRIQRTRRLNGGGADVKPQVLHALHGIKKHASHDALAAPEADDARRPYGEDRLTDLVEEPAG